MKPADQLAAFLDRDPEAIADLLHIARAFVLNHQHRINAVADAVADGIEKVITRLEDKQ